MSGDDYNKNGIFYDRCKKKAYYTSAKEEGLKGCCGGRKRRWG